MKRVFALLLALLPAAALAQGHQELRNKRYCEILPITLGIGGLKTLVFNTIGYNDCPQKEWDGISEAEVRKQFGAVAVLMNGPRYFLMDRIIPSGATAKGVMVELNGLTFESRAEVKLSPGQTDNAPYTEHVIDRETVYQFDAGKPTFRLTAPNGAVYVMQAYAAFVDKSLTYTDLPTLGARLKLPAGWSYAVETLAQDLFLKATGKATVVQDELKNTYQKLPAP